MSSTQLTSFPFRTPKPERAPIIGMLANKQRGDAILGIEINMIAGEKVEWRNYGSMIHSYMRARGLRIVAIPNVGWHVCTNQEQVQIHMTRDIRAIRRSYNRLSKHLAGVDSSTLNRAEQHHVQVLRNHVDKAKSIHWHVRHDLDNPPPLPPKGKRKHVGVGAETKNQPTQPTAQV